MVAAEIFQRKDHKIITYIRHGMVSLNHVRNLALIVSGAKQMLKN